MRKHEWIDPGGRRWAAYVTDGSLTPPDTLSDYSTETQNWEANKAAHAEILRLADENAALKAEAERLKKALDAYHRFNNIGNDLKSAQWTVGEWANGSDVSDEDLAYACKYLEDMA